MTKTKNTEYKDPVSEDYKVERDNKITGNPKFGIQSKQIGKVTYPTIDERFVC